MNICDRASIAILTLALAALWLRLVWVALFSYLSLTEHVLERLATVASHTEDLSAHY